jgi:hypothetical protein
MLRYLNVNVTCGPGFRGSSGLLDTARLGVAS